MTHRHESQKLDASFRRVLLALFIVGCGALSMSALASPRLTHAAATRTLLDARSDKPGAVDAPPPSEPGQPPLELQQLQASDQTMDRGSSSLPTETPGSGEQLRVEDRPGSTSERAMWAAAAPHPISPDAPTPVQGLVSEAATATPDDATTACGLRIEAKGLLASINAARADAGLGELTFANDLCTVAQDLAEDLASTGEFSHTNSLGQTFADRMRIGVVHFHEAAENIARADGGDLGSTLAAVMRGFLSSSEHRDNVLNPVFTHVGIGAAVNGTLHVYAVTFTD